MNSFGVAGTECGGIHLQGFSCYLLLQRPLPGGWREAEGRAGPGCGRGDAGRRLASRATHVSMSLRDHLSLAQGQCV